MMGMSDNTLPAYEIDARWQTAARTMRSPVRPVAPHNVWDFDAELLTRTS